MSDVLKIFMWPADTHSGCWTYRIAMIRDALLHLGHDVQTSQTMGQWAQEEADVIVGQRIAPTGPSAMWQIVAARPNRPKMVYEVDDDLFSIDPRINPSGEVFRHPTVRRNMIDNLRVADMVTVSTEPLAKVLRQFNPNVVVLPNCVRQEVLDTPLPARRGRDDGTTWYGWQGSQTHREDWDVARDAVGAILADDDGAHMVFVGAAYPEGLPLSTGRVHHREWTLDIAKHYGRVSRFDVSLAPLRDTTFNRSKSALRAIESLALGVPVVASDVPAYRGWVTPDTGFLVRSSKQWRAALAELRDPATRLQMGDAGRIAAKEWTMESNIHKWVDAYRSIL